jgi:Flp pilus assembly pilin Flp
VRVSWGTAVYTRSHRTGTQNAKWLILQENPGTTKVAFRLQGYGQSAIGWNPKIHGRRKDMKNKMMLLLVKAQDMLSREEGQDLVEYGLLIALIAFGAIVGMRGLATDINTAFQNIGTTLTGAV